MVVRRTLMVAAIVGITLHHAGAQFGGMPGMPGGPETAPSGGGVPRGGFSAPQAPPPHCQQLLTLRDEVQKAGSAIEAANQKKSHVKVACQLFRNYLSAEARMIKALESAGPKCGVPPEVAKQVRGSHAKAQQIGKQVCEAAARPEQSGPSLSDARGTAPVLPGADLKKGAGTFDTLTGNPFQR
jgi:hypothetical protein